MQESNAMAPGPGAWQFVDQLVPVVTTGAEGGVKVGHAVADVVNPRAALGQEPGNRGVVVQRFEEFDLGAFELQVDDAGPVDFFGSASGDVEDVAVELHRRPNIRHGDADMRDARLHGWGT